MAKVVKTTYFAITGLTKTKADPFGLIRRVEYDDGALFERLSSDLTWFEDGAAIKYVAGYNDDAEEITKEEAEALIEQYRSDLQSG